MLALTWRMQFCKAVDLLNLILLERKIKMNANSFTPVQATRANRSVLDLARNRRILPAKDCALDPTIFAECLSLVASLRGGYEAMRNSATAQLAEIEKNLGFTPPSVIKKGYSIVTCSIYTSGMEIFWAQPKSRFLDFIPKEKTILYRELFEKLYGGEESVPPKDLHKASTEVARVTNLLQEELLKIKQDRRDLVLLMRMKFNPSNNEGLESLKRAVGDLIYCPMGLAYLFYKNECIEPLVKGQHVLFDMNNKDHPQLTNWSGEDPKYSLVSMADLYDPVNYKIMFAVLV